MTVKSCPLQINIFQIEFLLLDISGKVPEQHWSVTLLKNVPPDDLKTLVTHLVILLIPFHLSCARSMGAWVYHRCKAGNITVFFSQKSKKLPPCLPGNDLSLKSATVLINLFIVAKTVCSSVHHPNPRCFHKKTNFINTQTGFKPTQTEKKHLLPRRILILLRPALQASLQEFNAESYTIDWKMIF